MKNRHVFHYDHSLNSHKGLRPESGYVATLRPNEGKFGGALAVLPAITNLLSENQSSWETDTTGASAISSAALARVTTDYHHGLACLRVVTPGSVSQEGLSINYITSTQGNYIGGGWIKGTAGSRITYYVRIVYSDATFTQSASKQITLSGNWEYVYTNFATSDSGKTVASVRLYFRNVDTSVITFYLDELIIAKQQYLSDPSLWVLGGTSRAAGQLNYAVIPSGDFTVSTWIKPLIAWDDATTSNGTTNAQLERTLIWGTPGTNGFVLNINRATTRYIRLRGYLPGTNDATYVNYPFIGFEWVLVSISVSGTTATLLINGVAIGSVSFVRPSTNIIILQPTDPAAIGYVGLYDELYIRPHASTADEVLQWYNSNEPFPNILPNRVLVPKIEIGRTDGTTWEDVTGYCTDINVQQGNVSAVGTGNTGADVAVKQMTFTLRNDGTNSFVPKDRNSTWNLVSGVYAPLIWPNREVRYSIAEIEPGRTVTANDYIEEFCGYLGDSIQLDEYGYTISCMCRDKAKLLQDCFIETSGSYGSASGVLAENVITQIMLDNKGSIAPMVAVENEGSTNLLSTPSFETDTNADGLADNWTKNGTGTATLLASPVWDGSKSQQLAVLAGNTCELYQSAAAVVDQGYMFRAALKVISLEANAYVTVNLEFYSGVPALLQTQTITLRNTDTGLVQRAVYGVAPATTATVRATVKCVSGGTFVIDAAELRTCDCSVFGITDYDTAYESVWDAIQKVPIQYGWFLGFRRHTPSGTYTSAGFRLMHLEPPRSRNGGDPDYEFDASYDIYKQDLEITDRDVRNAVKVTYRDAATGQRATITATDTDSINEYGRRAMTIEESDTSVIDTSAEATIMANAGLSDCKDLSGTTRLNLPYVPAIDVFTCFVNNNPRLSSTEDFYAVESYSQRLSISSDGKLTARTEIIGCGRVIGAKTKWLRMETRPGSRGALVQGEQLKVETIAFDNLNKDVMIEKVITTDSSGGWIRIAKTSIDIGANSALFRISYKGSYIKGSIYAVVSLMGNSPQIWEISSGKWGINNGITDIRVVYPNTIEGHYGYIELYNSDAIDLTINISMVNNVGWELIDQFTSGNIPDGYYAYYRGLGEAQGNASKLDGISVTDFHNVFTSQNFGIGLANGSTGTISITRPINISQSTPFFWNVFLRNNVLPPGENRVEFRHGDSGDAGSTRVYPVVKINGDIDFKIENNSGQTISYAEIKVVWLNLE
jgi:hypothetical protein